MSTEQQKSPRRAMRHLVEHAIQTETINGRDALRQLEGIKARIPLAESGYTHSIRVSSVTVNLATSLAICAKGSDKVSGLSARLFALRAHLGRAQALIIGDRK